MTYKIKKEGNKQMHEEPINYYIILALLLLTLNMALLVGQTT